MFRTIPDAEQWLDMMNPNKEKTTYIDEYNESWEKVGSFIYTKE